MIFLTIHKISYYKVESFYGEFRNSLAGWQFFNDLWKQRWQAGFWLHQ